MYFRALLLVVDPNFFFAVRFSARSIFFGIGPSYTRTASIGS